MSVNRTSDSLKAVRGASPDRLHATLALDAPVSSAKQVSPARAQALARAMSIGTVRDLLQCYPLRYVDMSKVVTAQSAQIGTQCTLAAQVYEVKVKRIRPKLTLTEVSLVDDTGLIIASCFNQPWLSEKIGKGDSVVVSGKVEFSYGFKRMTNPLIEKHEPGEEVQGKILPIHPATSKISRAMMKRIVGNALQQVQGAYDPLPLKFRRKYRLYSRFEAFRGIHDPLSLEDSIQARRRLRYEELFFLELELVNRERERALQHAPFQQNLSDEDMNLVKACLPFSLTEDQETAVGDILTKMAEQYPMNHLLLGDVGTGKTVVAAFALVCAALSGHQAMLMGPTEVLVSQYGISLGPILDACNVPWSTIMGQTPREEKESAIAQFACGDIKVLFGTHALLQDDVVTCDCSLVCIDEQQRFGVEQRQALIAKAPGADILSMTATPIPRSLALARYGGLSLSYLHRPPAKQGGRTTKVCHFSEEGIAYDALRVALSRGEQAYVICPLIGLDLPKSKPTAQDDEDDDSAIEYAAIEWGLEHDAIGDTLSAATKHAEILQSQVVPQASVALLHGKMTPNEKNEVMRRFRDGDIDVLVSTTVVEVGVDVPNATVMIIEDADRFGLAQLHQLRGRVGRGGLPGQVFLVSRSRAPEALERLSAMEKTEDGFALSEMDLSLRREGDIFGDRQHGASPLKLVNVVRDKAVIEAAYRDARSIFEADALTDDERVIVMQELQTIQEMRNR